MASIHKQPNRACYYCAFYDPEGTRRFRSTGLEDKQVAKTVCAALERAAKLGRLGKLSNEKALKVVRDTRNTIEDTHGKILADRAEKAIRPVVEEFVKMAGGELTRYTIESWLDTWISGHTSASKTTLKAYTRLIEHFKEYLGTHARRALGTLHPSQIEEFKKHLLGRVGPTTVNHAIKALKAAFGKAVAQRQLDFSPAEHVELIETDPAAKRPFTDPELKALWSAATGDWVTMNYLGRYTGQRINDCANLTWENADILKQRISLTTQKTKAELDIPMHPALHRYLSSIAGDNPKAPLCPSLHGKKSSSLSNKFHDLMASAGLVEKRTHKSRDIGRDKKRQQSPISFHSFRYNATTELKEAGVAEALVMKIIGHESRAVSRGYTGFDEETTRKAVSKMKEI
ncbi:MAG: integrase family protein [Verrucomicrobia bacterium]|nr:integrase family protein [Verrucomicrobiota bacterium]